MQEQYAVSSVGCQVCFCRKCGIALTEENWQASRAKRKDRICIACCRAYQAAWRNENKESAAASCRKWAEKNRERRLEYRMDYHQKNKEKIREYRVNYYRKNKIKLDESYAEWARKNPEIRMAYYETNKEEILAKNAKWRKENGDKCLTYTRNRRARVRGAKGSHTAQDIRDIYAEQGGKCAACEADLSTGYHVDHIQAIINGGSNDRSNLQVLCPFCNSSKGSKDWDEFLLYLELRNHVTKPREPA